MTTSQSRPVLVGIDYSPDSMAAVELAAWEAKRRGLPLRLVHALSPPPAFGLGYGAGWMYTVMTRDSERMLAEATAQVQRRHPGLEISHLAVTGSPAAALVSGSEQASLVVVGARGAGGFPDLLAGSVSGQVATHAHVPVLVVRRSGAEDVPPVGPVVVGVDGSEQSADAVAFAFEEADARHTNLVAVYAWDVLPRHNLGPITRRHYDPLEAQDEAERVLAEGVCGWTEKYPDVAVSRLAIHTLTPAAVLREAAAGASLTVVGSRGHGGFAGMLLGSVSRALVSHAPSSVAIVHDGAARTGGRAPARTEPAGVTP